MSPFKSEAQRKFLWAKHPEVAKKWTKKYGSKVRHAIDTMTPEFQKRYKAWRKDQLSEPIEDDDDTGEFCKAKHKLCMARHKVAKLWKEAKHSGVGQIPTDYTKKLQGQHCLQHGVIPNVKTAHLSNLDMAKFASVEVNFLKEGWYRTNGKAYYYPWEIIERDAKSFKGKPLYLNHDEYSGAEMGLIEDVYTKIVHGVPWLVARVKIPEANFAKAYLERIQAGLVKQFSSTHDFIVEDRNPNKVQRIIGKALSSVKEGEVEGTGVLELQRGLKSAAYKQHEKDTIAKLWKDSKGGLNG